MKATQTTYYMPKGEHFTASTYVFIAPEKPRCKCKPHTNPLQYSRERISIRWNDRRQKYCVRSRPLFTVLFYFCRDNPYPNLDQFIEYITLKHRFMQIH